MTTRITKATRQKIVREFALRHNGQFNPALFFEEVREAWYASFIFHGNKQTIAPSAVTGCLIISSSATN